MKRIAVLLLIVVAVAVGVIFLYPGDENLANVKISVPDMMCESCVEHIEQALGQVDGVKMTEVSLEAKTASITFNADKTDENALQTAIQEAGYGNANVVKDCDGEGKAEQDGCEDDSNGGCCSEPESQTKT